MNPDGRKLLRIERPELAPPLYLCYCEASNEYILRVLPDVTLRGNIAVANGIHLANTGALTLDGTFSTSNQALMTKIGCPSYLPRGNNFLLR